MMIYRKPSYARTEAAGPLWPRTERAAQLMSWDSSKLHVVASVTCSVHGLSLVA